MTAMLIKKLMLIKKSYDTVKGINQTDNVTENQSCLVISFLFQSILD